jgi:hypothetical protein
VAASERGRRAGGRRGEALPGQPRWTVLVFMGTHTVEDNVSLEAAAVSDLAEMAAVGSGDGVAIVVQAHGPDGAWRQHIGAGDRLPVPRREASLDGGDALPHFVAWGLKASGHRDGDHTLLVFWGHAYDFAIGRRQTSGGLIDPLDFAEIDTVLRRARRHLSRARASGSDPRFDVIAFDACDLATVEVAWQLAPSARYLLASQSGIPIPGLPYDVVLERLRRPIGNRMTSAEFGAYAVRRFCESYAPDTPASLACLDLDVVGDVFDRVHVLALLLASATVDPSACARLAALAVPSQTGPRKPYLDVTDFCIALVRGHGDPMVVEAARALGNLLVGAELRDDSRTTGAARPFVVEHGANTGEYARLNGVSLYAPHLAPHLDVAAARALYERLDFASDTVWNGLVHALASPS